MFQVKWSNKLPFAVVFLLLLFLNLFYQSYLRHLPLSAQFPATAIEALLATFILYACVRLDLMRLSVGFLALPYLFFLPGWLNTTTAIVVSMVFIYCLQATLRTSSALKHNAVTASDVFGFVLILVWVNLSGAGAYGYQTGDYLIHNARLKDLVEYPWPIRYGDDQNLVYYLGYFLPAAVLGKLSSLSLALHSMYLWTALGVMLALRWLSQLSQWRFSVLLAGIFILFGPLDLLTVVLMRSTSLAEFLVQVSQATDSPDFLASQTLGFFIGNYLSNSFQLFWSPQQVIAGWIGVAMMTHLFFEKKPQQIMFVYALLCLWAPLVMIALLPFAITACFYFLVKYMRDILSIENTLGAGVLAVVFVAFYLAGSTSANPSFWIFDRISQLSQLAILIVFMVLAWGFYALFTLPWVMKQQTTVQIWFACLILTLVLLLFRTFGEWADLLCRGSAPLMFLLLVFFLRSLAYYWQAQRRTMVALMSVLLVLGTGSAWVQGYNAFRYYGAVQPVASIITYYNAYPNLGPDNTFFEKYFRKPLSDSPTENTASP